MRKAKLNVNKTKQTNKKNKRIFLVVISAVILAALIITAVVALINGNKVKRFSSTSTGGIMNTSSGTKYTISSGNLSPRVIGEQYGEFEGIKLFRLYTVNGEKVDSEEYLIDEDGILFRGLDVEEISLDKFNAIGAYIFHNDQATGGELFPKKEYLPESEKNRTDIPDDSELTKKITDILTSGDPVVPTGPVDGNERFELRFCSADHPAFYYCIFCMRDENGSPYLYDAAANSYYDCPDELAVRLW